MDLDLPPGLGEIPAPGVEAMTGKEESVERRTLRIAPVGGLEAGPDLGGEFLHVLSVGEDRHLLEGVVGDDAVEPFEHLVAFDPHGPPGQVGAGEDRRPHRVGVEDRADGGDEFGDQAMEKCFSGGLSSRPVARCPGGVDPDEVVTAEGRLVLAADGDRQFQRGAGGDDAVVAARSQRPTTAVELPADGPELVDGVEGRVERWRGKRR